MAPPDSVKLFARERVSREQQQSYRVYLDFITSDKTLESICAQYGIKSWTAAGYITKYVSKLDLASEQAEVIRYKLRLPKQTVIDAYEVTVGSQTITHVSDTKSKEFTSLIHQSLGPHYLYPQIATRALRSLYLHYFP